MLSSHPHPSHACKPADRTDTAPQGGDHGLQPSAVVAPFKTMPVFCAQVYLGLLLDSLHNTHISVFADLADAVNVVVVARMVALRSAVDVPQMQLLAPHIDQHPAQCLR